MKHNFLLKRLIIAFTADNSMNEAARKTTNFGYCNSHRVRRKTISGNKLLNNAEGRMQNVKFPLRLKAHFPFAPVKKIFEKRAK
jgi:hypothetical protein